MKIIWIGQAGFLFENEDLKIMIDPYLSDSVKALNPKNYRRVAIEESLFEIRPDIMIFTHNHLDHYDPETVQHFITDKTDMTVLSPSSVWEEVRKIGGANNFVRFNRHSRWTQGGITFTAVKAEHSDRDAIGVIIDDGEKKYYITGDTLYNTEIFEDLPQDIYAVFLPVNGVGNNMNMEDAKHFAEKCGAKNSVPIHFGMFDSIVPEGFDIIPKIYEEVKL